MPDEIQFDCLQSDSEVLAFVLRVRKLRQRGQIDQTIVHLTDVSTSRTWHLTSLDDAFAEIRGALKLLGESQDSSRQPH